MEENRIKSLIVFKDKIIKDDDDKTSCKNLNRKKFKD